MEDSVKKVCKLPKPIADGVSPIALAPMQDVTNWTFLSVLKDYGNPDYYFNEYFRVHEQSTLEPAILRAIAENPTGRPVFAQFIGENLESFGRMIALLKPYPVAGIDLNMGCPAPKVYKKNVGGGLLRDLQRVDSILGYLRDNIEGLFTVKCRIGFEDTEYFPALLDLINKHGVDHLSVHGRTVKQLYRGEVDYTWIRHAVQTVRCTVFANGNLETAKKAREVLEYTGAHGVMIGRAAIRNPWIFRQWRELHQGRELFRPRLADVRVYIERLYEATLAYGLKPRYHASVLKKFLNFISQSVDAEGAFQYVMRRAEDTDALRRLCDEHLLGARAELPFSDAPYPKVHARSNCES